MIDISTKGIFFVILSVLCLFVFHVLYTDGFEPGKKDVRSKIASMAVDAFFIALLMLMTFVPSLGFIAVTPAISLTLLHLPVLLGAALFGPKKGLLYGFVFGLSSYVQALSSPGFNALFAYPWVAIPPRMLFGFIAGIAFSFIGKLNKTGIKAVYLASASFLLTILHTLLVFGDLLIFHYETVSALLFSQEAIAASLTFFAIIAIGATGEATLAAIITPSLYGATQKAGRGLLARIKGQY